MRHRPLLLLLLAALLAACDARLQRLELSLLPAAPLPRGLSAQLVVVGRYSDGTQRDLTSQAVFATTDANVAILSDAPGLRGRVRAVAPGQVQLTARSGGVSASTTLTVSDAVVRSLALAPEVAAIARGTTQTFKATATLSDDTTRSRTRSRSGSSPTACAVESPRASALSARAW